MALAKLDTKKKAEEGVEISILDPTTDRPTGVFITVYGSDSETFRTIQRRQTNHRLELGFNKKRNKKDPPVTAEMIEEESLDLLVGCTKSWRTEIKEKDEATGNMTVTVSRSAEIELDEGEWLSCTPENVRRVYKGFPWLKEQIDQEIGDRSNFLQS